MITNNPKVVEFLLHQLANNEQDRKRFSTVKPNLDCNILAKNRVVFNAPDINIEYNSYSQLENLQKEVIIRTCLSRADDEAVLKILEDEVLNVLRKNTLNVLYTIFDYFFHNGKSLDEAIQALHDKMLELVPEYKEFLNNNQ